MLRRVYRFDGPTFTPKRQAPEKDRERWRRSYRKNAAARIARNADWRKRNPDKLKAQREREKAKRRKGVQSA